MARRNTDATVQPAPSQNSISDAEGDESQRLLALSSLLQSPKPNHKVLQDFRIRVTADQHELRTLLGQRMRDAEQASMRRRNQLTRVILEALQTPNRAVQGAPSTFGESKIARNVVFKSGATVLKLSKELVDEYIRLDKTIVDMRDAEPEGVADSWAEEVNETARLLKIGAETAIRNIKKVLGAHVKEDDIEGSTLVEDGEATETLENMELNYELHKGLLFAERGVRKMVRSLPKQEEDKSSSYLVANHP